MNWNVIGILFQMVTRDYRFDSVDIGVENKERKKKKTRQICVLDK